MNYSCEFTGSESSTNVRYNIIMKVWYGNRETDFLRLRNSLVNPTAKVTVILTSNPRRGNYIIRLYRIVIIVVTTAQCVLSHTHVTCTSVHNRIVVGYAVCTGNVATVQRRSRSSRFRNYQNRDQRRRVGITN